MIESPPARRLCLACVGLAFWSSTAGAGIAGAQLPLRDCPLVRRATLSLAGLGRMPENELARFANLPEMRCQDVHVESITVFPGRVKKGRQALEIVAYFAEHPPAGRAIRHALRFELVVQEKSIAEVAPPPWSAAKTTRSVVKALVEVGEARLAELLALADPPVLRVTLEVREE